MDSNGNNLSIIGTFGLVYLSYSSSSNLFSVSWILESTQSVSYITQCDTSDDVCKLDMNSKYIAVLSNSVTQYNLLTRTQNEPK